MKNSICCLPFWSVVPAQYCSQPRYPHTGKTSCMIFLSLPRRNPVDSRYSSPYSTEPGKVKALSYDRDVTIKILAK
jgi:hypothetical protein